MGSICSTKTEVDDSTPPPPEDIFDTESLEYKCNELVNRCLSVQRIHSILIDFKEFKKESDTFHIKSMYQHIDGLGTTYDHKRLLNDYVHLITVHQSEEAFEAIYNYLSSETKDLCDVVHCNHMNRNQRDRSNDYENITRQKLYNTTDTKEINIHQIIDKIHCYWLHSFDLGYRLTLDERRIVEVDDEAVDDDDVLYNCIDHELIRRQRIIRSKRERLFNETVDDEKHENKSIYNLNERNNKFILNATGTKHKNENEQMVYSFGFPYCYGKYHKKNEWYIAKKYESFKEELTQNKIQRIRVNVFDDWYQKALDHIQTDHCKGLIYYSQPIEIHHIMAVIIYCGDDLLQRKLTETYRKMGKETDEELRNRHSEYGHWGQILKAATNTYGMEIGRGQHKNFYHGINEQMLFESTLAYFHGPLSTSTQYTVALSFANGIGDGLFITLNNANEGHATYFDCEWLSDFAYESEKFFIGGEFALVIKNITAPQQSQNYVMFVAALNIIQQLMNGLMYRNTNKKKMHKLIKKCVVTLLHHELHRYFANEYDAFDGLPQYIDDSMHICCLSMKQISIDWSSLQIEERQAWNGYKFMKTLLVDNDFDGSWIDLKILCVLFPNIMTLTVTYIPLVCDTLESIRSFCKNAKSDDNLKQITIYRPIVANNQEVDTKQMNIDQVVQDYNESFVKYGWKLEKRGRFELYICRI